MSGKLPSPLPPHYHTLEGPPLLHRGRHFNNATLQSFHAGCRSISYPDSSLLRRPGWPRIPNDILGATTSPRSCRRRAKCARDCVDLARSCNCGAKPRTFRPTPGRTRNRSNSGRCFADIGWIRPMRPKSAQIRPSSERTRQRWARLQP